MNRSQLAAVVPIVAGVHYSPRHLHLEQADAAEDIGVAITFAVVDIAKVVHQLDGSDGGRAPTEVRRR